MHCPITGINIPRFILSLVAGFIFVFGFEFAVHAHLLADLYEQTAELWRPDDTMEPFFPLMILRTLLFVAIPAFIYTRKHEGKGIMEGVRFGIPLGLLLALMASSTYIWMPIPLELAGAWAAADFVIGLTLGVIYALTYKK